MNKYPLLIMTVMLGLCFCLQRLYPVHTGFGLLGTVGGWIVVVCGISLLIVSAGLFHISGTTVHPTRQPGALVTAGIYHLTRNPMYLGMMLILSGIPFVMNAILGLIFPIIFFLIMDRIVIPREEKVLEGIFSESYRVYKSNTRRWI